MNAEQIAAGLEGARRSGNGWAARCPAHDDRNPSLSVDDGEHGPLVRCHAGCSQETVIAELRARGLWPAPRSNGDARPAGGGGKQIAAAYPYTDRDGVLLLEVVRGAGKKFWQRQPDGRGGWINSAKGVQRMPYRRADLEGQTTVWIPEGERDVDRLMAAGIPATCNLGGAEKWRDEDTAQLREAGVRRVVALPDNDAPGRRHALQVARSCRAAGMAVKVVELPNLAPKGDVSDYLDGGGTIDEIKALVKHAPLFEAAAVDEAAPNVPPDVPGAGGEAAVGDEGGAQVMGSTPAPARRVGNAVDDQRPEVRVTAGAAIALCRELAQRLADAGAPLYRRGPLLMRATRITSAEDGDGMRRSRDALILQRVSPAMLMGDVSLSIRLTKFNLRQRAWVPTDLPDRNARAFIEHAPELVALPAVTGITECPIMLPSGELVTTPGHDTATGLIFDSGGADWRALRVPDNPTGDDVSAAVDALREPFRDFPFVTETDQAVALSAVVTAVLRPQLPAAPLHGINATAPGTGKTLIANTVGMIATGRPVPAMAMGESAEEFAKRIDAALLAADPVALIDNVSRPISGDTACINLTAGWVRVRILGRSEQVEIPAKTFWLATGNSLTFRGDMTRRALLCTLDAGIERPDLREFGRDLQAWVPTNRLRLLSAVFTLLRGFIRAGSPKQGLPPLGGFETWTRRVRDALVWAGLPDVLGSTESIRNDDPELQQRVAIYQAWRAVNGDEWRQLRDIKHAVRRTEDNPAACVAGDLVFAEELASIGPGARFDARAFGWWLRSNKGRIAGGLRLEARLDRKTKVQAWRVAPVGGV